MKKKVVVLFVVVSLLISSFSVCNFKNGEKTIMDSSLFATSGSGIQVPFEGDGTSPDPELPDVEGITLFSLDTIENSNFLKW